MAGSAAWSFVLAVRKGSTRQAHHKISHASYCGVQTSYDGNNDDSRQPRQCPSSLASAHTPLPQGVRVGAGGKRR